MALDKWTGTLSALWSDPANWSNGVPQTGDDVQIETASSLTVTYATGTISLDSMITSMATLSVTGGSLGVANGYDFGGALTLSGGALQLAAGNYGGLFAANFSQTGGAMTLLNGATAQGGTFSQTGGTMTIANGDFLDRDGGIFSGKISGAGRMQFAGYGVNTTIAAGFSANVSSIEVIIGTLGFTTSLTYAKTFALDAGGTLNLSGNTLTLSGAAGLDGDITSGTLNLTGTGHLNGLVLDNGQLVSIGGTYNETGPITLGNSGTGTLSIASTGELRLTNNNVIASQGGGGTMLNAGTLIKVGGGSPTGESVIYGDFSNTASGQIDIAVGTLDFRGPSNGYTQTLMGTITGAGTMSFDAGNFAISNSNLTLGVARVLLAGQSTTTTLTTTLNYSGNWDQTGGTLAVGSPGQSAGTLSLTGEAAFDGGLMKGTGTVLSSGAVALGNNMDLEGNLTFNFSGPVSQTGNINLGLDGDAITIANVAKGDTWNLKGGSSIFGFNGMITNNGTFAKLNGAGTSTVQSDLYNNGTLAVDSGQLTLSGVGTLAGSVIGGGVLDISGAYQFDFGTPTALSVSTVILDIPDQYGEVQATLASDLTFANNWDQEGGTLALSTLNTGYTLTLNGNTSLQAGAIDGGGSPQIGLVVVNGPAFIGNGFSLLQGAQVEFNGPTEQAGSITLTGGASSPLVSIGAGDVYTMDSGAYLGGPNGSIVGTLAVGGTLVANGAGSTSVIAAAIVDNGSIQLGYGEMQFLGSLTGTGSVTVSNGATLDLLGSSTITNTITFGHASSGILDLGTPDSFLGTIAGFSSGDMVELDGFQWADGGTLVVQGKTVTITDGNQSATLNFSSAQTLSQLVIGEGPHGWLSVIHT